MTVLINVKRCALFTLEDKLWQKLLMGYALILRSRLFSDPGCIFSKTVFLTILLVLCMLWCSILKQNIFLILLVLYSTWYFTVSRIYFPFFIIRKKIITRQNPDVENNTRMYFIKYNYINLLLSSQYIKMAWPNINYTYFRKMCLPYNILTVLRLVVLWTVRIIEFMQKQSATVEMQRYRIIPGDC